MSYVLNVTDTENGKADMKLFRVKWEPGQTIQEFISINWKIYRVYYKKNQNEVELLFDGLYKGKRKPAIEGTPQEVLDYAMRLEERKEKRKAKKSTGRKAKKSTGRKRKKGYDRYGD